MFHEFRIYESVKICHEQVRNCEKKLQIQNLNWSLTCDVKIELKLIISYFVKDVHWGTVCSFSGLIGFIVSLLLMIVLENQTCLPDSIFDRAYIVLIGLLSFAGQVTLVYLAKIESNLRFLLKQLKYFNFQLPIFDSRCRNYSFTQKVI